MNALCRASLGKATRANSDCPCVCLLRKSVTAAFGIVTGHFGNVTVERLMRNGKRIFTSAFKAWLVEHAGKPVGADLNLTHRANIGSAPTRQDSPRNTMLTFCVSWQLGRDTKGSSDACKRLSRHHVTMRVVRSKRLSRRGVSGRDKQERPAKDDENNQT
jgi:hypothetical protein